MLGMAVAGGIATHLAMGGSPASLSTPLGSVGAAVSSFGGAFGICGMSFARNCVIDGDTIEYNGARIRMIDYDTPEISDPKCASEYALGQRAKLRLLEILNSGTVDVRVSGSRDIDKYGRKLRLVLVNGRSVGDILISEGLAWRWEGRRHSWCS